MSNIVLNQTIVNGSRVDYDYTYPNEWNVFVVNPDERLFAEYNFDLTDIPKSILNIPFVANMLTLAMFENDTIFVDELDKSFYDAIPQILDGYRSLYPDRRIECSVKCAALIDNAYIASDYKIMAFTGGVDATSAVASHLNEKLVLANIWGGDIRFDNESRYRSHRQYFEKFAHSHGLDFQPVKSNFRFIYDDTKIPYKFAHDWWAAIAHSLLIVATLSVIAYCLKAAKLYLASTYTINVYERNKQADSNYSEIVNNIRVASCVAEQCDSTLTRVQKINNIVEKLTPRTENSIQLLACWNHQKDSVVNCCRCEKCARTIMNIKACKTDPNLFGFQVDDSTYAHIKQMVLTHTDLPLDIWNEIQEAFLSEYKYWKKDKNVNWILKAKINQPPKPSILKRVYWKLRRVGSRVKHKLLG